MDKQEYMSVLEKALVGRVDPDQLRETINYYQDYFYMEGAKGKTEQEIIQVLGDPRLLAKSIIAAQGSASEKGEVYKDDNADSWRAHQGRQMNIPLPIILLIIVLLFFGLIGIVFSIASALLPILLPILIVFGIISLFKKR